MRTSSGLPHIPTQPQGQYNFCTALNLTKNYSAMKTVRYLLMLQPQECGTTNSYFCSEFEQYLISNKLLFIH